MTGGSAPKRKGGAWEREVVTLLRRHGWPAERRSLRGPDDRGDVVGVPGVVIECKAARRFELGPWLDETVAEAARDDGALPVLVVKRPRRQVGDAFAVLRLDDLAALLRAERETRGVA